MSKWVYMAQLWPMVQPIPNNFAATSIGNLDFEMSIVFILSWNIVIMCMVIVLKYGDKNILNFHIIQ